MEACVVKAPKTLLGTGRELSIAFVGFQIKSAVYLDFFKSPILGAATIASE
jgi:hypothetical protein